MRNAAKIEAREGGGGRSHVSPADAVLRRNFYGGPTVIVESDDDRPTKRGRSPLTLPKPDCLNGDPIRTAARTAARRRTVTHEIEPVRDSVQKARHFR